MSLSLSLAPMEGVMDWIFRDLITAIPGSELNQVTTEFLRVTRHLHTEKIFYRYAPELLTGSRTRAGTPLYLQLLGGEPEPMAMNAKRATELGALGVDLNFGCPAKTVNRHDGGASLLRFPDRLQKITAACRSAMPASVPLTAKMRLGFEDTTLCIENALALQEGGASVLTVHCRTKKEGYRPPAHWEWLARLKEFVKIPIIANGDIVDAESLKRCQEISGCDRFMMGREALKNPHVFTQIRAELASAMTNVNTSPSANETENKISLWSQQKVLLTGFYQASTEYRNEYFATARTKQFLRNLSLNSLEAKDVFDQTKILMKPTEFSEKLFALMET